MKEPSRNMGQKNGLKEIGKKIPISFSPFFCDEPYAKIGHCVEHGTLYNKYVCVYYYKNVYK